MLLRLISPAWPTGTRVFPLRNRPSIASNSSAGWSVASASQTDLNPGLKPTGTGTGPGFFAGHDQGHAPAGSRQGSRASFSTSEVHRQRVAGPGCELPPLEIMMRCKRNIQSLRVQLEGHFSSWGVVKFQAVLVLTCMLSRVGMA